MTPGPSEFRSLVEGIAAARNFLTFWRMSGSLPACKSCRKLLDALAMRQPPHKHWQNKDAALGVLARSISEPITDSLCNTMQYPYFGPQASLKHPVTPGRSEARPSKVD